jgi:serine/threonine protein kinase
MRIPKVIGEGTYGCVHKPTLKCKLGKHNYTKKVSKIMTKRHAKAELKEYSTIAKVDKTKKYYLGKPDLCEPKVDAETIHAIEKCENAEKYKDVGNTDILIMEDGGLHLKDYADKMRRLAPTRENKEKMAAFWIEARRMLMAVKELLHHKVIHHDMKPENIVYDEKRGRMNLIDFGFMTTFAKIRKESVASKNWLSQMHWSYPPEIEFYNKHTFLKYASLTEEEKGEFVNAIYHAVLDKNDSVFSDAWHSFFYYVLPVNSKTFIKQHFKDFEEMLLQLHPATYSAFLKQSMVTIDVYGLGIAFVYVLNHTSHLMELQQKISLESLFSKMISSNVFQRIQIDDLIKEYDMIFR